MSSLVIALSPIGAIVWEEQRRKVQGWMAAVLLMLVTAIVTAVAVGIQSCAPLEFGRVGVTLLVIGSQVATAYLMLRILRDAKPVHKVIGIGMAALLLWSVPLIIETMENHFFGPRVIDYGASPRTMSLLSPLGMLNGTWDLSSSLKMNGWSVAGLAWEWGLRGCCWG